MPHQLTGVGHNDQLEGAIVTRKLAVRVVGHNDLIPFIGLQHVVQHG